MFAKLANPGFLAEVRPLLAPSEAERLMDETMKAAFADVFTRLVTQLPGNPWVRTEEMAARFGVTIAEQDEEAYCYGTTSHRRPGTATGIRFFQEVATGLGLTRKNATQIWESVAMLADDRCDTPAIGRERIAPGNRWAPPGYR